MADFYVDSDAVDDTGVGSIGDPWKYISTHVNPVDISAGDTVWVRGDVGSPRSYTEAKIAPTLAGSDGSPICLRPYTGEQVAIRTSAGDRMFEFDSGAHWWELRDLTLDAQDDPTQCIYISDSDHLLFKGLTLKDGARYAIYVSSSDHTLVQDCTIYNFYATDVTDANGFLFRTATNFTVEDCTVYDIYGDGAHHYARADPGDPDPTVLIRGCHFYTTLDECSENAIDVKEGTVEIVDCEFNGFRHCDSSCGGSGGPGAAIIGQDETVALTVHGCEIYDCAVALFLNPSVGESFSATVDRNLIRDLVDDTATPAYQPSAVLRVGGNVTCNFYNNTVVGDEDPDIELFHFHHALSEIVAKNNIFYGTGSIDNGAGGTLTCDYNLWYLHEDREAGANDVVDDNPDFVGGGDYSLQAGSPAIDEGTSAVEPCYFGSAPDMGAFEYSDGTEVVKVLLWRSNGTGDGDVGDLMCKVWMDEYASDSETVVDFSAI